MTKRTSDADRLKTSCVREVAFYTDDGIELQQRERRRRIVEVHTAVPQLLHERFRQRIGVDFQTDGQRRLRTHAWSNTTKFLAFDRAMQLKRVRPKRFVAKRIEAESLFAFIEHPLRIRIGLPLGFCRLAASAILFVKPARIAESIHTNHDNRYAQKHERKLQQSALFCTASRFTCVHDRLLRVNGRIPD